MYWEGMFTSHQKIIGSSVMHYRVSPIDSLFAFGSIQNTTDNIQNYIWFYKRDSQPLNVC